MFEVLAMLIKVLAFFYLIDIFTLHKMSSKNIELNICAYTWHSVSVMGHEQGLELTVPELQVIANCDHFTTPFYPIKE